jgi:hypothetical protein
MHDMTTAMVSRYKIWLDAQQNRRGEPFTPVTKHHQMSVLRQLVDWTKRNYPRAFPLASIFLIILFQTGSASRGPAFPQRNSK